MELLKGAKMMACRQWFRNDISSPITQKHDLNNSWNQMTSQIPVCQKNPANLGKKHFWVGLSLVLILFLFCVLFDYIGEQHAVKFFYVKRRVFDLNWTKVEVEDPPLEEGSSFPDSGISASLRQSVQERSCSRLPRAYGNSENGVASVFPKGKQNENIFLLFILLTIN